MAESEIIKSGGHCYDGCGWFQCSFWVIDDEDHTSRCMLFGSKDGVLKETSKALEICNRVYGIHYNGNP